jgi:predicted RNase H-like HicB family nuclease
MSDAVFYIALIHKDSGSDFGVSFPDFPGCVSAGETLAEAAAMAREALEGHVALMIDEGEAVPEPSSMDAVMANPDNRDGTPVMVPLSSAVLQKARTVRVNITLPEDALREIDRYAEAHGYTRSGFLTQAAKRAIGGR